MTAMLVAPEPEPVQIETLLTAGLEGPDAVDAALAGASDSDIRDLVDELELLGRRVAAVQLSVMDHIDSRGLHNADGHVSAKVMVRHLNKLSAAEAAGREKARHVLAELPELRERYLAGEVGTDQVRLLGRVHANRRVAPQMAEFETTFIKQAQRLDYLEFEIVARHWERLADQDGAEQAAERSHRRRDFTMVQDHFGLGWNYNGGCGPLDGAAMAEIFEHYLEAERLADWEAVRALHGDDATAEHLPRTEAQRRADALRRIFEDAASTPPDSNAPRFVHHVKWDHKSFEQMLTALAGGPNQRLDIDGPDRRLDCDVDSSSCETVDGVPLAPTEAIVNAYLHEFRRVIVDSAGTVIDLGVARRFTGSARLAAQLQANRCIWPGCHTRVSQCEIDHNHPHSRGGGTNPGNGAPLCGRHNRWKQKHFTVWRDPDGVWHTYRPDGTEIT